MCKVLIVDDEVYICKLIENLIDWDQLGMSDRIVVIRNGEKAGELEKEDFSQVKVLEYASGLVA